MIEDEETFFSDQDLDPVRRVLAYQVLGLMRENNMPWRRGPGLLYRRQSVCCDGRRAMKVHVVKAEDLHASTPTQLLHTFESDRRVDEVLNAVMSPEDASIMFITVFAANPVQFKIWNVPAETVLGLLQVSPDGHRLDTSLSVTREDGREPELTGHGDSRIKLDPYEIELAPSNEQENDLAKWAAVLGWNYREKVRPLNQYEVSYLENNPYDFPEQAVRAVKIAMEKSDVVYTPLELIYWFKKRRVTIQNLNKILEEMGELGLKFTRRGSGKLMYRSELRVGFDIPRFKELKVLDEHLGKFGFIRDGNRVRYTFRDRSDGSESAASAPPSPPVSRRMTAESSPKPDQFEDAVERVLSNQMVSYTPREILGWWGAYRRGAQLTEAICRTFAGAGIAFASDFAKTDLDEKIPLLVADAEAAVTPRGPADQSRPAQASPDKPSVLMEPRIESTGAKSDTESMESIDANSIDAGESGFPATVAASAQRSTSRFPWNQGLRLTVYGRLVSQFGEYRKWAHADYPGERDEEYENVLAELAVYLSRLTRKDVTAGEIREQVRWGYTEQPEMTQSLDVLDFIVNKAAALEARFIRRSDLPERMEVKQSGG